MNLETLELRFVATAEKGEVSALRMRPEGATHVLVLGSGASSNMRTPNVAKDRGAVGGAEDCDVSV